MFIRFEGRVSRERAKAEEIGFCIHAMSLQSTYTLCHQQLKSASPTVPIEITYTLSHCWRHFICETGSYSSLSLSFSFSFSSVLLILNSLFPLLYVSSEFVAPPFFMLHMCLRVYSLTQRQHWSAGYWSICHTIALTNSKWPSISSNSSSVQSSKRVWRDYRRRRTVQTVRPYLRSLTHSLFPMTTKSSQYSNDSSSKSHAGCTFRSFVRMCSFLFF